MKKTTHGGARKGAGRKAKEPTKTMRIPISKVEAAKSLATMTKDEFLEFANALKMYAKTTGRKS